MEKGKYRLSPKQARACYILRRRRRELTRRINSGVGSKESIRFDLDEHQAISALLDLVREVAEESEATKDDDGSPSVDNSTTA